jgi:hypothetical protein
MAQRFPGEDVLTRGSPMRFTFSRGTSPSTASTGRLGLAVGVARKLALRVLGQADIERVLPKILPVAVHVRIEVAQIALGGVRHRGLLQYERGNRRAAPVVAAKVA